MTRRRTRWPWIPERRLQPKATGSSWERDGAAERAILRRFGRPRMRRVQVQRLVLDWPHQNPLCSAKPETSMTSNVYADKAVGGTINHGGRPRRSLWKRPALMAALLLLLPLLGNQFVEGWNWPPGAFVRLGVLLFGVGFTYQLITRNREAIAYRAAVGLAFATGFLLTWGNFVQMADLTPAAAMYFGVPIVGIIGAAVACLRPKGMARALFVTALAQALVLAASLTLLISRSPQVASWTPPEMRGVGGNALFAVLFAGSALLFRKAGRGESATGTA